MFAQKLWANVHLSYLFVDWDVVNFDVLLSVCLYEDLAKRDFLAAHESQQDSLHGAHTL